MTVRIVLRAMPEAVDYVKYLTDRIPGLEVVYDQKRDAMDTFLRAMRLVGVDPAVHIEDDIILCDDFVEKVQSEVLLRPHSVIQFFSFRDKDLSVGSRWDTEFSMNQCFYLPAWYSKQITAYWPIWRGKKEHPTAYDFLMEEWLKKRKEKYWIHVPSLVQHRTAKSRIDSCRSSGRQSRTFIGEKDD